jgi:nucleoprotein TPR
LQAARTEILNLNKATTDIEERFGKYRAEKVCHYTSFSITDVSQSSELSTIQTEHEGTLTRLTSVQNSYNSLQRTFNDQSRRLAESHANIATLTTSAASKKASTSLEYHRLLSENQLLEKRGDEARAVVLEREAELERMVNVWEDKEKVWEDRWKRAERGRKEAEKRSEDLKVVVERLALAGGEGGDLSPAAALAGGMKASGKTYTQFYTDYTIQEGKLRAAENEVVRLTLLLDEISQDINEKVCLPGVYT